MSIFCNKCGADNPDEFRFCYRCGAPIGPCLDDSPEEEPIQGQFSEPGTITPHCSEGVVLEFETLDSSGLFEQSGEPTLESEPTGISVSEYESEEESFSDELEDNDSKDSDPANEFLDQESTDPFTSNNTAEASMSKTKNNRYRSVAIAAVAVVIILIITVAMVSMTSDHDVDDGYMTFSDIPHNHPLYGVSTPNGSYYYDADCVYQGSNRHATVEIQVYNDRFTYFAVDGIMMSQSELDELNGQSLSNSSFKLSEKSTWNDGSNNYRTFLVTFKDGSTSLIAENGMLVQSTSSA